MAWLSFHPEASEADRRRVTAVLAVAIFAVCTSAVLVRKMEALPLAIAAWRTFGAALVLSPALLGPRQVLSTRDAGWLAVAGLGLALHFWTWFAALGLTTVLRGSVLVSLVPVWTAGLDWLLWRRVPGRGLWFGIAVALPGMALLGGDEGRASLAGDGLALLSGLLWSATLAVQSGVRQRVGAAAIMAVECTVAALALFAVALATSTPLAGWPMSTWALLAAAVVGPQLLGHQGYAYALRWVPASTIALLALLEPVGASALAAVVLGERPGSSSIAGGLLVLLGVTVALRSSTKVGSGRPTTVVG